ncbi:DUF6766 family protein [Streptomyces omiyaensis]|uniref:DUF6766 family protein n=1 Tax=Streptomyces omiyaensis TaxID=68247 RepID=A0ABW7C1D1_9ACTN|nr:DUF6766 family protein [Streptomyces omiyaensis]GGY65157.1 hypothetical protein GCM10010363_53230 [Streptomyces omiyaensis]
MTGARDRTGFWRSNSLTLVFGGAFLVVLAAQAVAGRAEFNEQLALAGLRQVGLGAYLASSDFAVDVTENWQSEFLQFFLYVYGTVYLLQRGSPESKPLDRVGTESERDQRMGEHARSDSPSWAGTKDWRQSLYSRSLGLTMAAFFVLSWFAQSVAGAAAYDGERLRQLQEPIGWGAYLLSADFWSRSLQNWQSELLAVAAMAVLSVYLRQRGSPESKPVGSAHASTGVEG